MYVEIIFFAMPRLSKKEKGDDRHTYCKIRDLIGNRARIPGPRTNDSRSDEWKEFVRCLTETSPLGEFGFGVRLWFVGGDMQCNDCFDSTSRVIVRRYYGSEFYAGKCAGSGLVCHRFRPVGAAMKFIDTLFRDPPIARCSEHESTDPNSVRKDTRVGELYFEFKDRDFCVDFYQD